MIYAIRNITDRKSAALRSTKEPLLRRYAAIQSIDLEAGTEKTCQKAVRKVALDLRTILFGSTIDLILYHEDQDADRAMTSELKIFLK